MTKPDDAKRLAQAAALLGVPQRALAAWVAEYRRAHQGERRGRRRRFEDAAIAAALEQAGGNVSEAARILERESGEPVRESTVRSYMERMGK